MNMPARILLGLGVVVAAIWGWNSEWGQLLRGRWSFTESVSTDTGTYFRLKVKVAYKGEPVDFDIVVGCNVRRTGYKDGSSSVEVGMVPVVFGKRMPDNKGLVVRAPDACGARYIKEGWIPDDLLPVMVVYDDADTLAFGTAYMSEDAYASPLSVLRFERATITAATRQEFDAFRKEQTNLVSRAAFLRPIMGKRVQDLGLELTIPFGNRCQAYERYRIPDELRARIREAWPADRPRYWWPGSNPSFAGSLQDAAWQRDIGGQSRTRVGWGPSGARPANQGVLRTAGGGVIKPPGSPSPQPQSLYPVYSDNNAQLKMPARLADWPEFIRQHNDFIGEKVDFRDGKTRGFAYCYVAPSSAETEPFSRETWQALVAAWLGSPVFRRVDGVPVRGAPSRLGENLQFFLEDDEYFFNRVVFSLEGTGSDV
jgi:hypothetical protein